MELAPGIQKENALREAGFTEEEIGSWRQDTQGELSHAGFSGKEIDAYFGIKEPDMAPVRAFFKENLSAAKEKETTSVAEPKPKTMADSFSEAVEAGWQLGNIGLLTRGASPDTVLPIDAPMAYRIASQVATLAGDFPTMVFGGIAGAAAAAPTGPVGAGIIGGGTAFALPTALRESLMQGYEKGEIQSAGDFLERASSVFLETSKSFITGAVTAGVGGAAAKIVGPAASPLLKGTAVTASEVAAMTTVSAALEGELPEPEHIIDAAILVGGLRGAGLAGKKIMSTYGKTGVKPEIVANDAMTNPVVQQDVLADNVPVPRQYQKETSAEFPKVEEVTRPKLKDIPEAEKTPFQLAQEKVLSQIGEKPEQVKEKYTRNDFYKDYVDKLDPINRVDKESYLLSRVANDAPAKVKHVFENGTLDFETLAKSGKGFKEILDPVKEDLNGFQAFIVADRALEIEARGLKSGIDVEAAKEVVKAGKSKYQETARELVEFQNRNLKYLKDSGRIDKDAYQAMVDAGKSYIPFSRILDAKEPGAFTKGTLLKELKGSENKIQNPFTTILENTNKIFEISEKNRAVKNLVEKEANKDLFESVEIKGSRDLKADEFEVYRGGKREVYKADKNLAEAIKALDGDAPASNMVMKLFKSITAVKKFGITALDPAFHVKNLIRDFLTASSFSKEGFISPVDLVTAMKDYMGKTDAYYNWLKSGGAGGAFLEMKQNYLDTNIFKLQKETNYLNSAFNIIKKPVDFMRVAGHLIESAPRLAQFKKVTKGATSGSKVFEGGFAAREVTLDFQRFGAKMSALNSITAFQNVSIQGLDRSIRAIKDNPGDVALKAAMWITTPSILLWWANKDDKRVQEEPRWRKDNFWIIATDDWQKAKAPEEYDLLPDHLIRTTANGEVEINKGTLYRIPKPQELGLLFGSLPERILDAFFTENPDAFKDFGKTLQNLVTPSFIPDAIAPVMEQYFNKSTFTGAPIIPHYVKDVLPEFQYTEYSSETAKAIGKMIPTVPVFSDLLGLNHPGSLKSPAVLDNYIRSWSGTLGGYIVQLTDKALTSAGVVPDPVKPAWTLSDTPFVKAFIARTPSGGARSITDFYERFEQNQAVLNTVELLAKKISLDASGQEVPDPALQEVLDQYEGKLADLSGSRDAISNLNKAIRNISQNPTLTPDDKRQQIDGLYYSMIEIAKAGVEAMREFEKETNEFKKQLEQEAKQ